MRPKFRAAVGSLLVTAVAAGAMVAPASSHGAQPGDLCWVHTWAPASIRLVMDDPAGNTGGAYYIAPGGAFRVLAYGAWDTYYGRGNGMPNGYLIRGAINQATCTQ